MHVRKYYFFIYSVLLFLFIISANSFAQKETTVVHPEWSKNATIYEVNVRQYTPEGTFNAFAKHLPELKKMGVKILWIMPINPIGIENRKGTLGSYYSVRDYKAINPEFGTLQDFKNLVDKIHKMGMHVIIDWVANHTSWDNKLTKTNPDFYKHDSLGNFVAPVKDWSDVIALNYNNPKLWDYMEGAMEYWVKDCNIDGFRCDVASMVPVPFWNFARKELDKIKPVFMLAESENPDLHEHAFDMTYSWEYFSIIKNIAKDKMNVKDLDAYFKKDDKQFNPDAYRMVFTTNHDENSWNGSLEETFGAAEKTFAVLCGVIKGMPLIYSGQEAGLDKELRFFDKDTIDWRQSSYRELYTKLVHLKLKNKALWNGLSGGEMQRVKTNNDKNVFAFMREKDGNKVFAIFNLSNENVHVTSNSDAAEGSYKNLFDGNKIKLSDEHKWDLKPWDYKVYYK